MIWMSGLQMRDGSLVIGMAATVNDVPQAICRRHQKQPVRALVVDDHLEYDCEQCLLLYWGGEPQPAKPKLCEMCDTRDSQMNCPECGVWVCFTCSNQGVCKDCAETNNELGIH